MTEPTPPRLGRRLNLTEARAKSPVRPTPGPPSPDYLLFGVIALLVVTMWLAMAFHYDTLLQWLLALIACLAAVLVVRAFRRRP